MSAAMTRLALFGALSFALGCNCGGPTPSTPGRFGEVTSAVVIVNPVINQGSSTTIASGNERSGVEVKAAELDPVSTDPSGLTVVEQLPTGNVSLTVAGASTSLNVVQEKELYDVVVSLSGGTVQHVIPPVRYPIGGDVTVVEPGTSLSSAVGNDNAVVFLKEGSYPGGLEVRSSGVLIFGAWSPDGGALSTIDGNVSVFGGGNRIRGVKITGRLTSSANNFSAAFCDVGSATITGNGVSLLRNRFTSGQASVPSSNAVLVDNTGIP